MSLPALVQRVSLPTAAEVEKRGSTRHLTNREAVSRRLDHADTLCWGATVRDISSGGVGLSLCFPFRPGTYLAIDVQGEENKTLLGRVVHVEDQADGTWFVGCEFVKPLQEDEVEAIV